jgi:hypothetical protein
MIWRKFNLIHHLISWRNRFGSLSSRRWALSATLARGWNNEDRSAAEGLDFSGKLDPIGAGAVGSAE